MNLDFAAKKVREGARVDELVSLLCEDAVAPLKNGEVVNVNHGIWAGSRGTYVGEANAGYVRIKLDNGGEFQLPSIFVTPSEKLTA